MTEINIGLVIGVAGTLSGVLMAVLALAISRAPGWRELRSFAFVSSTAAAYCFFNLVNVVHVSDRALVTGECLALGSCLLYGTAWIRHLGISEGRPLRPLERGAIFVGVTLAALALLPGLLVGPPIRSSRVAWLGVTYSLATATPLGLASVAFVLIAILTATFGGGRRWRDGWHARLPMIGATTLVLAGICDTLTFTELIAVPQMTEAMTVVVVGTIGVAYARRFVADAGRLEALSTQLEQEVAIRTGELLEAQALVANHERLAGLGRIAAGVAHEINNPTMVIQQNLDRLRALLAASLAQTPELGERIDRSRAATQHIAAIVRQLLETGRQAPTETAQASAFEVGGVVRRAIAAASATTPELRVTVDVDDSLCVRGAPMLLEQALINLLINAAHAAKDAPVRIHGARDGERVRLTVVDRGPGISPTVRDRLFEPFATTKAIGQGTGLGLAVSRGLMTRQGGALFLGSTSSAGTEMVLELPSADLADAPSRPAPTVATASSAGKSEVRVLVIEDNDDLREVEVLMLGMSFHVEAAATVEQALAMVSSRGPYDAVLCDLMMPNGGAEAWLSRCGALDPRLDERTILLTGGPTTAEAAALVEARGEKVVYKPADIDVLRAVIERVTGLRDSSAA